MPWHTELSQSTLCTLMQLAHWLGISGLKHAGTIVSISGTVLDLLGTTITPQAQIKEVHMIYPPLSRGYTVLLMLWSDRTSNAVFVDS